MWDRETAFTELRALLGERFTLGDAVREQHGHDESLHPSVAPDAVCFPRSTREVSEIARICHRHRVPMIPFGTGTGMEGQVCATHGGLSIDLSGMNALLELNQADFDCTVQPGITRKELNRQLRETGLFFPVDPGADASVGGMVATRASGTTTVRYGTIREQVLRLEVVLADGRVIRTGSRARKSAAGYDLTHLFVGSEGTLGIVTAITLRLHPVPEAISAARINFPDVADAVDAVIATLQCAIPIARIEILDEGMLATINAYSKTDFPLRPTLFVEFHGSEAGVREQTEQFGAICADFGGGDFAWTANTEQRNAMWEARHNAAYAVSASRSGAWMIPTDVCVPVSRLAECIAETRRDVETSGCHGGMLLGHVGDGNFHLLFTLDRDDPDELARFHAFYDRLVARALAMDGTCSAEHGIGLGKQQYLVDEFGQEAVDVMRSIRQALDPMGLMNPGKKIPLSPVRPC